MQTKKPAKSKDELAVIVGFILIALIGIITVLRLVDFKSKKTTSVLETKTQDSQIKYATISTADLQKKATKDENILILDVRSDEAYINEHIIDALHIPVDKLENNTQIDLNKEIFIVGENSKDSSIENAVKILKNKKVKNVTVLAGGMESWKNLGGQTITSGDPNSFLNQAKVNFIKTEELKNILDDKKLFLIDGRPNSDFVQGHIKNAVNIPFEEIEKRRNELPYSKTVVVYDANEVLGFQTAVRVYDLTSMPAYDLRGGFDEWKNKGFEVVK